MLEQLRKAGMSLPQFEVSLTSFRLVLSNHTLFDAATLTWLERAARNQPLSESQRQALAYLHHSDQVSNADYRRLTGVDSRVATRELTDLVNRGLIERQRVQRWVTYIIVKDVGTLPPESTSLVRSKTPGERIITLLQISEPLLSREIAESLGITQATARSWLRKLRNQGSIVAIVSSLNNSGTRYSIADAA
ncbi:MAG: ArsR family transcriptional regulator [Chloroflexota bacterium]|nr:ArsR family transcriptional regulator [Chloroflexota bacterium]